MKEEYKLIFLTLLVRLGLGTLVVYLTTSFIGPTVSEAGVALTALVVTASGLGLSLFHIGRPVRILNTFANRRSSMSWEAILAPPLLIVIFALACLSYLFPNNPFLFIPRALVLILAMAFIFVTGKVYHLRARPSWSTPLVLYEYFTSAAILGLLGFAFILVVSGTMTENIGRAIGVLLIPLLAGESIITFSYRNRAMNVTPTARQSLASPKTKKLYFLFVLVGLVVPAGLAVFLVFGVGMPRVVPAAFIAFLLGAVWWRVLFFRSATLIKITPDIAI